ncbi:MAG: hypothetical protein ACYSTG_00080 [Planctomycetota bacterium]
MGRFKQRYGILVSFMTPEQLALAKEFCSLQLWLPGSRRRSIQQFLDDAGCCFIYCYPRLVRLDQHGKAGYLFA